MISSLRRSSRAVSLCDRFKFSSQRRLCVLLTTILRPSVPGEPSSLGAYSPLRVLAPPSTRARIVPSRTADMSARSGLEASAPLQRGSNLFANLAAVNEPRGFLTVAHAEDLVGGAQVLLYRRLGKEEVLGDLCVAQSLGDEVQYLPLADGERVEIRGVIVR